MFSLLFEAFTLLFGNEALLEKLQYEIRDIKKEMEDIREGLTVNQQRCV